MKIPALVVIYNPNIDEVISNIKTYISEVDILYVFDNTDNGIHYKDIIESHFLNIKYYSFGENRGIAFALNYISQMALESKYEWILTMDQDSSFAFPEGFICYLKSASHLMVNNVAFISPLYPGEDFHFEQFYTSGSLINLKAWSQIKKFNEELFIDEVDGDFTYRLLDANYSLKKIDSTLLNHKLGDVLYKKIFYKTIRSDNHSALRKYYIARNRIYLMKQRPSMRVVYCSDSLYKFIAFILIESDKKNKLKMILRGIYDGITNNMGKYGK